MCQECAKAAAAGTAIPTTAYHATPSARCNMDSSRPRNSTRAGKARSVKSLTASRRKPTRSSKTLASPRPKRPPANTGTAAAEATRVTREGALLKTLRLIQARLKRICSTAIVVAHALREQHVELDVDAADVLRDHVSDPLFEEILRLKRIVAGGAS